MSEKSEMQKHLDGELFWNSDPEISAAKSRARALCDEYNLTKENQPRERLRLLKEIFGSCDDDIFIKPPFHCDYGYNIHVGKRFFANFDVVILSIKDVETSCLTTITLKDHGARFVVAQAAGDAHAKILERIGADKVVMPEKDIGTRLARSLASNNIIDYMELSARHSLMEIAAIDEWIGHTLKENNIRAKYGVNVVAIRTGKTIRVSPQGDDIIHDGDILVVIGENADLEKLTRLSKRK